MGGAACIMHIYVHGTNANASMSACKPHVDIDHASLCRYAKSRERNFQSFIFFVHDDGDDDDDDGGDADGRFRKMGMGKDALFRRISFVSSSYIPAQYDKVTTYILVSQ